MLQILHRRCRQLGVELNFQTEITDFGRLADADLVVAADGINSLVRERYKEHFEPTIEYRRNHFIWLGSTAPSAAFNFHFATDEHGIWDLCTYQYKASMSTWVIEVPERSGLISGEFLVNSPGFWAGDRCPKPLSHLRIEDGVGHFPSSKPHK